MRLCFYKNPSDTPHRRRNEVAALRLRMHMTQKVFCKRFGFTLATLRHWERSDRRPTGTAKVLLELVRHNPSAVAAAVSNTAFRKKLTLNAPPR